jgi:CheY-like chemotaxis protein
VIHLPKILVIDDSAVLRDLLAAVLKPHCGEIVTAADCAEARRRLRVHRDCSLVLCDVILPDGNGLDLLEEIVALDPPKPDVILMTARPDREDAQRAHTAGAAGYLAKPISFRTIVDVLHEADGRRAAAPLIRRKPLGRAYLMEPAAAGAVGVLRSSRKIWNIHDMSTSGAFLETPGPIEVGTVLDLCIDFGRSQARVLARTVRVQEPDWGLMGGVGIAFREFDAGSRELLASQLAEVSADRY